MFSFHRLTRCIDERVNPFSSSFYPNSSFYTVTAFHNLHHQIKDSTDKVNELPSIVKESVSRKDTGLETQQDEVHISAIHMTCMFKYDNVHGDGSTMSSKKKDDKILLSVRNTGDCFQFQGQDLYKFKPVRDNISCAYLGRGDESYKPNPILARVLNILIILHAEHEMNCYTAATRHLTSSGVDVYTALAEADGALYGPLHGGANEIFERKDRILEQVQQQADSYTQ